MNGENQQITCVKCGFPISAAGNFCGECGTKNEKKKTIIEEVGELVITKLGLKKNASTEYIKRKIEETTKLSCTEENLPEILEILKKLPDYLGCPKCGIQISTTDKFCSNCGAKIILEQQSKRDEITATTVPKKDEDSVTEITEKKEKKINPTDYYFGAFKKYAVFSGRAQRAEYWYFFLFNIIIGIVLGVIDSSFALGGIYSLAALIPGLALSVRRLHDVGKSGWMLLVALIPLIGAIWLLILMTTDSNPGDNEYGSNPKGIESN